MEVLVYGTDASKEDPYSKANIFVENINGVLHTNLIKNGFGCIFSKYEQELISNIEVLGYSDSIQLLSLDIKKEFCLIFAK